MAISAVLQIGESGGNFLQKALASSYTVLDLDYTIERSCDKTGRPSGSASISCITVTIRAANEKNTPFHKWIKEPDFKMDGKITIYDSTGKVASTARDFISGDSSFFKSGDSDDTPDDMKDGAKDDGSGKGDHEPDIYDEMSHEDLMEYAEKNGIQIDSSDNDDDIREKIRKSKKGQSSDSTSEKSESLKDKAVSAAKDPLMTAEQKLLECARNISFTDAYCVSLREHFNNDPDFEGKLDTDFPWTLEIGIKPKKVTFSGSQVFTKSLGSETEFELY